MMHLEGLHTWGSQVTCMTFDKTDVSGHPDTISAQNVGKEVERAQNRGCLFARKWQTAPQVDLDMHIKIVDGDHVIADTAQEGSFLATCAVFEDYVRNRFARAA